MEGVAHLEVEEVHRTEEVEQIFLKLPIILDMDKMLAAINQITEISSNSILSSIRVINNIQPRNINKSRSNTNLHQDPTSTLHLVTCKLRSTLNLKFPNTDSKMDSPLDRIIKHTETNTKQTHHLENVHETKPSAAQTEAIP